MQPIAFLFVLYSKNNEYHLNKGEKMDKNIEKLLNKINNQNLTTAFIIAETNDNHITEIRIRPDSNIIIRMDGEIREVYGTYQNTDTIFSIFLKKNRELNFK